MIIAAVVKTKEMLTLPDGTERPKRRVYLKPTKKDIMKSYARKRAEALGLETKPKDPIKECGVCYKKRPISEMIEVQGGGTQGHPSFFMCNTHI